MQVNLSGASDSDEFGHLFAEELGLVVEVSQEDEQQVLQAYTQAGLTAHAIGHVTTDAQISISVQDKQQISGRLSTSGLLRSCRSWQPQHLRQSQSCCHRNGTCQAAICKRLGVDGKLCLDQSFSDWMKNKLMLMFRNIDLSVHVSNQTLHNAVHWCMPAAALLTC